MVGTRNFSGAGFAFTVNDGGAGNLTYFHVGGSALTVAAGITTGKWYSACATYSATTLVATLYLNGALLGSQGSFAADLANSFNGVIGDESVALNGSANHLFAGTIDDVRIYNRALSAQEVQQLYALGAANIAHSNTVALSSGLVGYWPFDGNTTSWRTNTTQDVSGNNNTGTLVGMSTTTSPVAGKIGGALTFNGSQYINAGDPSSLKFGSTQNFSIAFWATVKNITETYGGIVRKKLSRSVNRAGYLVDFTPNNLIFAMSDGTNNVSMTSSSAVNDGRMHFFVVTVQRNGNATMFMDGVANGTPANVSSVGSIDDDTAAFLIGGIGFVNSQWFKGTIDDVRIYNRALSAQEVAQLYLMGK